MSAPQHTPGAIPGNTPRHVRWVSAIFGCFLAVSAYGVDFRRSGFDSMSPSLQAMQRDDAQNPGHLLVAEGQVLWAQPAGAAQKSCAQCHGAPEQMRGVAARYPAWDAAAAQVRTLSQRIEACRQQHQQAAAQPPQGPARLALEALVASQSRGLPIAGAAVAGSEASAAQAPKAELAAPAAASTTATTTAAAAAGLRAAQQAGAALFQRRMGQLNLSCAQCHDTLAALPGARLGSAPIPQGHPTAYPIYRLEWQGMGTLQRRLRACMSGVRATPFDWDAPEWTALEAYLMQRAAGLLLEAPGVRP